MRVPFRQERDAGRLELDDGSRVAVVGGGPSGAFFSYFLSRLAETVGLDIGIDIYEPRHFDHGGPAGCNHCGGIISESLVQLLATEGINLPPSVIQRGIDSYVLHMDVGTVRIETPLHEKRIASVFRGAGPLGQQSTRPGSFDGFLLGLATANGARLVRNMVSGVDWADGRPQIRTPDGSRRDYDLLVVATGINSNAVKLVEQLDIGFRAPRGAKTFICEFLLGEKTIQDRFGASMHVFLLDLPRLEFAALIPKGEYVTLCLLGNDIDEELVQRFLDAPEVRGCFPEETGVPRNICHCFPRLNVKAAVRPFADRMVMIGDAGVTRLFKDGIGAAYRTAKAAATTVAFQGVSARDFRHHYWPTCRSIDTDNMIGKAVFAFSHQMQKWRFSRRALLRMTSIEQQDEARLRHMSTVLWDVFTGSAPYREVFFRSLRPAFVAGLGRNILLANCGPRAEGAILGGTK